MSKETVKQYIRNQYTGKEQCQFLPQMNQQDSLAHSSLKSMAVYISFPSMMIPSSFRLPSDQIHSYTTGL